MKTELGKNLKTVLDNMRQEQFGKEWQEVEKQGFPNVLMVRDNSFILELQKYIKQMVDSKAEYDKKPLKKILDKIDKYIAQ